MSATKCALRAKSGVDNLLRLPWPLGALKSHNLMNLEAANQSGPLAMSSKTVGNIASREKEKEESTSDGEAGRLPDALISL